MPCDIDLPFCCQLGLLAPAAHSFLGSISLPFSCFAPWPCSCARPRRCPRRIAKPVGWQAPAKSAVRWSVRCICFCCLRGVAARRLELLLDHELRGQLALLHAAEAQAVDAVFYLRHLIQLRLLRTGRLGPVAWLIAPWLPLGFCSCLFASWSVLCLALEGVLSRRSAGRDAVADLRPHTAPSYASQSRPASPSQPAAPRAPRLLGGGLRSDVALLDVCRLQRTADVSLAEGAGRPLRKRGAARPPGGGLAPRRLPPK